MAQAAMMKKDPANEADHLGVRRARMNLPAIKNERLIMAEINGDASSIEATMNLNSL
jgi:hypothetical protein